MSPTYNFQRIALTYSKGVRCSECGRRVRRQRTFEETLNPFNLNAEGLPKTRAEIGESLNMRAAAWDIEPEVCAQCKAATP